MQAGPGIMPLIPKADLVQLRTTLQTLRSHLDYGGTEELKRLLRLAVPEYAPDLRLDKLNFPVTPELEPSRRHAAA